LKTIQPAVAKQVQVEPLTPDDWEILVKKKKKLILIITINIKNKIQHITLCEIQYSH
jgi:hypothetical protein